MPELCRFYGIIIRMLFNDTSQHHKPHIHIVYSGYRAVIGLDRELLAGFLPDKQFTLIKAWMIMHEEELYQRWNLAVQGQQFEQIEPLR